MPNPSATEFIYVYDGECAMCSTFVRFLIAHDDDARFRLATAQSEIGRRFYREAGLCPDLMETALLIVRGRTYTHLEVFTESLALLGWPWKSALVFRALPRPLANWLYRRIANNRKIFNGGVCPAPTPEIRRRFLD